MSKEMLFNGFVLVNFKEVTYEVVCIANGTYYKRVYPEGYIDHEIDDIEIKDISKIYNTDEQIYLNTEEIKEMKSNEDFTNAIIDALEEEFDNGSDNWINTEAERQELARDYETEMAIERWKESHYN